ncbi:MAG: hypothetical protein SVZ03_16020 [Spirochaetota bacterium]|nr:hypothetical protein [Spirochaetota bacterium]
MEKDQLQSLKLEISRKTQLLPYERIAFHKILGILKSENGMKILLRDIYKESVVRESAISVLKNFNNDEVLELFLSLLNEDIEDIEKIYIFDYLEEHSSAKCINRIIEFIECQKEDPEAYNLITRAFNVLRIIGEDSKEILIYLQTIVNDKGSKDELRSLAIIALSSFKDIFIWEELLKEENEDIIYAAYKSISMLCDSLIEKAQKNKLKEDELFTYHPELEEKIILDIRVLLGKMTSYFDNYSTKVKIAFINAMISSNHREFLIYVMKSLTSNDVEQIDMTLDLLLNNIKKVRDPDKLFRNLLSFSVDSPRANETIVDIFENFFSNLKETRKNMLLRDKLYNYIIVTLETYFENYRKEFMVSDVIEKGFPQVFQNVRNFILENFTHRLKKRIVQFLKDDDRSMIPKMVIEISKELPFLEEEHIEGFTSLIELLFEEDEKSREVSASRIDDINIEKRYLRDRIVRLCRIIGRLNIVDAASPLVIIYNFVKKYPDIVILEISTYTLSMLNYSYILGELEVMLTAGDEADQKRAIRFLSLYSDQRALNIILDFIKDRVSDDSEIVEKLLEILLRMDISGNVTTIQILKSIIESNPNQRIRGIAIPCLGKCGNESDIDYLNELFYNLQDNDIKASIVQAIGFIIHNSRNLNKRQMIKRHQEYLKEPGIRVRIYSCLLLIQLGNKEAHKSIMDMMSIKNKEIQREILSVMGNLKSVEFAYFLISLLKDEYAIANDIIPVLKLIPEEDLKEIDHFIVNIFKKHEGVDLDASGKKKIDKTSKQLKGLHDDNANILNIEIINYEKMIHNLNAIELTMVYQEVINFIISEVKQNKGVITRITQGRVSSYFQNFFLASNTALKIYNDFQHFNKRRLPEKGITVLIQIITDRIQIINEEMVSYPEFKIELMNSLPLKNRILVDENTVTFMEDNFYTELVPELIVKENGANLKFFELISPINLTTISEDILRELKKKEQEKIEQDMQLEVELKKRKLERRSTTAVAYAQTLDDIGRMLKSDLEEIDMYIQKRTTDGELIKNTHKMLDKAYKRFFIEKSKLFIE